MNASLKFSAVALIAGWCLTGSTPAARAAGTEEFGNKPVSESAHQEWPNLTAVINDTNRVYGCWVNGGEEYYFAGRTDGLNAALERFAAAQASTHEMVLLPGPANVASLKRDKNFDYDWSLKINGGISGSLTEGKGGLIWSRFPQLRVFVGGDNIDLNQLLIPKGVTVLETSDLRKRYTEAIKTSSDINVRGWGAVQLAQLDPYSATSVATVTNLLSDTNDWVRMNAASALAYFGKTATPTLPALRQIATTAEEELKDKLETTIAAIEAASDVPASDDRRRRRAVLEVISTYCRSLSQKSGK